MSEIADAINGTVADIFGDATGGGTEDTVQVAAPEAEVAPQQEAPAVQEDTWDFEAAGRDLFAEDDDTPPDFGALAEEELGLSEGQEDVLAPNDYDDDTTRELKKQLLAERKKREYHERRHLDTARKAWEADVRSQPWGQFLPKDLSQVKASSHREFNRQAKALAKTAYEVLKPHYEKLAADRARLLEQTKQEARQEAVQAWGKPTVGGSQVPAAADNPANKDAFDTAVRRRDMFAVTKALIDSNQI